MDNISDLEKETLNLLVKVNIKTLEYYDALIKLDESGLIDSSEYQGIVLKIKENHNKEKNLYDLLDKNRIYLYDDYLLNILIDIKDDSIRNKDDSILIRIFNYFYNTISLKKVNNKVDIRDNIFEIEGLIGSLINFDLDGIYIYELYSNYDNQSKRNAYKNLYENYFVEYVLLEANFDFDVLNYINYRYYTQKLNIDDKFVLKCLEEIVNEFESYIYSVKEIDSKEDIIAKIMAYFVILEITDNETLDNFMNKVDIPDDEEDDVLEYISEAFERCLSSLNNYKKVYKN